MAEACRSRTDQSRVYQLSPVLKTGRVTGPHALPQLSSLTVPWRFRFSCGSVELWHNPQNVVLHFHFAPGELCLDALLEFCHGGSAVLAVEAAGVVHQHYVLFHRMAQDGLQFGCEALLVTLETGPAVIAGVQPEEHRHGE